MSVKKITNIKTKLVVTLGFVLVVMLLYYFDIGCMVRRIIGVPCMGCGLTRAWLAAFRLDFAAAFGYHHLFFLIPYIYLWLIFDFQLLPWKKLDYTVIGLILAAFVVRWVIITFI